MTDLEQKDSMLPPTNESASMELYEQCNPVWKETVLPITVLREKLPEYFGKAETSWKRFLGIILLLVVGMLAFFFIYPWKFFANQELKEETMTWEVPRALAVPVWAKKQVDQIETSVKAKNFTKAFILVQELKEKIVSAYFDTPQGAAFLEIENDKVFQKWLLDICTGISLELSKNTSGASQTWYYKKVVNDFRELSGNPLFFEKSFSSQMNYVNAEFNVLNLKLLEGRFANQNKFAIEDFIATVASVRGTFAVEIKENDLMRYLDMMEAYGLASRLNEFSFANRFMPTVQNLSRWKRFCDLLDRWRTENQSVALNNRDFLTLLLFKWETILSFSGLPWEEDINIGNQRYTKGEAQNQIAELKKRIAENDKK